MQITWTKPYLGVQHVNEVPDGHQVTVTDYGTFTRAYHLWLRGPKPFSSTKEETFNTPEEARAWGEQIARSMS